MTGYSLLTSRRSRGAAHFKDAKRPLPHAKHTDDFFSPQYFSKRIVAPFSVVAAAEISLHTWRGKGRIRYGIFCAEKNESCADDPLHM